MNEIKNQDVWGDQAIERANNTLNAIKDNAINKGDEATKEDVDNAKQKMEATKEQMIEQMNSNPNEKYRDKTVRLSDGTTCALAPETGKVYDVRSGKQINDADKIDEFKSKAG